VFLEPILEQPITSEHRTTAPSLTFGNVRRSGPTPTGSGKIVLYPTNELPDQQSGTKELRTEIPAGQPGGCSLLNSTERLLGVILDRAGQAADPAMSATPR
jgi:hypothetical protein